MRLLVVTSVAKEADAIADQIAAADGVLVVSGVGRVNAACAVIETVLREGPFDAIINAGVAGALPMPDSANAPLRFAVEIGDLVAAAQSSYYEEGIVTPDGFRDAAALGFPLASRFIGNAIDGDGQLLDIARYSGFGVGRIATVATCSGTNAAALSVAARCDAVAEAMEGAAVLHAAARLGVAAIELRAISNTTGDRDRQVWDLVRGLKALGRGVAAFLEALHQRA